MGKLKSIAQYCTLFAILLLIPVSGHTAQLAAPTVILQGVPTTITANVEGAGTYNLELGDKKFSATAVAAGALEFTGVKAEKRGRTELRLLLGEAEIAQAESRVISGWLAIAPPFLAIAIALIFHSVIPALFFGIWVGVFAAMGFSPGNVLLSLLKVFETYVRGAVANADHAAIVLFTFMIGGMVGIVSRNGGMQGVVNHVVKWASTPRRGQAATAMMGIAIFFDDYANTMVVGNTMRRVSDALKISREKLAFIVDSTAAPISCIALVTTWVGYEVGLIDAAIGQIDGYSESAYLVYLKSIGYSFYPILMLIFVFLIALGGRDFAAMHRAETRARTTGQLTEPGSEVASGQNEGREIEPLPGNPCRAINAVLPVLVLVLGVLTGLFVTGEGDSIQDIIGSADSYKALMWASLAAVLVAAVMTLAQRILTMEQTVQAWYVGVKMMLFAMIVLVLAWTLSSVTEVLHTADYLVSLLGDFLPPAILPVVVFVLAALTAFATGTSWGTMGILLPIVVPLAWAILAANDMTGPDDLHILYSSVACVLTGAVWGDHCSPISDTTILSSMASGCNHIDHVRTQLPYAMLVGMVAIIFGALPAGFGLPWWIALLVSATVLVTFYRIVARPVPEAS
ncbi:MAG: Na+/H+ antiporter NhaC family protein [Gammaproteobacteria bacterium]|nr:Na+/H+ antiporter NhaC family protein [Gammaproteobacteria bacterium]